MPAIKTGELEALIKKCLSSFYQRRIAALDSLDLKTVLSRKNPYLFRDNGITNAPEMIKELLGAHISSSDEGMFGEEFFEPICKSFSSEAATIAGAKGVDFVRETDDAYEAIALKSGPNALNSAAVAKQGELFEQIRASLRATLRSSKKEFLPVMGCGYGRVDSPPTKTRKYYKMAGQVFWAHLTGDSDFYLKIIRLIRDDPDRHKPAFKEAWDKAVNRFVKQFSQEFCDDSGNILWEKLVEFNSAKTRPGGKEGAKASGQAEELAKTLGITVEQAELVIKAARRTKA